MPRIYAALLSQEGTAAPIATVLENTLCGTPVWTTVSPGQYRCTLTGAFPYGKVAHLGSPDCRNGSGLVFITGRENTNSMMVYAFDGLGQPQEIGGPPCEQYVEFRVYP